MSDGISNLVIAFVIAVIASFMIDIVVIMLCQATSQIKTFKDNPNNINPLCILSSLPGLVVLDAFILIASVLKISPQRY